MIVKSVVEVIADVGFTTLVTMTVTLLVVIMLLAENVIVLLVKLLTVSVFELYNTVEFDVIVVAAGKVKVIVFLVVVGENVMLHVYEVTAFIVESAGVTVKTVDSIRAKCIIEMISLNIIL